ncbi:phosphotransferase [Halovivax gelatinilyticus]|uniref:phosphotransferase n=1 Tax=Halovivax gelatinilyticus TaxID=2961597 RepID=UPI0020CA5C15|nr:phosphotransferase [Halovivax gelatinilyticus]
MRTGSRDEQRRELAELDVSGSLEPVFRAHREGRLDADVVDRFFERRTVGWRVELEAHARGRGLVIGDHDECVPLAFAELLESVWVADTNLASLEALDAVGEMESLDVNPVHATIPDLPFPSRSFDLVVLTCAASELPQHLPHVTHLLAPEGRLALVVDGWTRELGLASMLGVAPPAEVATRERIGRTWRSMPTAVTRRVRRNGLAVERSAALLTRGRHENELAFDVRSDEAVSWVCAELGAAAGDRFELLRTLARLGQRIGVLSRCYPRYLYVCRRERDSINGDGEPEDGEPADDVIIAGKNRTTVLSLDEGELDHVRKVPNSRRQAVTNEVARRATTVASAQSSIGETIPDSTRRRTAFGPVRVSQPVSGTPLDRVLDGDVERFERVVDAAFSWLERLQSETATERVENRPSDVVDELTDERFGLTDPPRVEKPVEVPQVLVHGDYFGSNVYLGRSGETISVTGVIDWEWASPSGNPIVDAGFFSLQVAEAIGRDFEAGFDRIFVSNTPHSRALYDRMEIYLSSIGIDPAAMATYLPIGYVERSRRDVELNGRLDVDWPGRVRYIWDRHDEVSRRLSDASPAAQIG